MEGLVNVGISQPSINDSEVVENLAEEGKPGLISSQSSFRFKDAISPILPLFKVNQLNKVRDGFTVRAGTPSRLK